MKKFMVSLFTLFCFYSSAQESVKLSVLEGKQKLLVDLRNANGSIWYEPFKMEAIDTSSLNNESGTFIDPRDNNEYKWIKIGNQIWMAENLKATKYSDSTEIPNITGNSAWAQLGGNDTDKAYCWYNDDEETYKDLYGACYTYAAATNGDNSGANVQGVCPDGWHLPSDDEWTELENYISSEGHLGEEGKALKATSGWKDSGNGTDNYGFSALPVACRIFNYGIFSIAGYRGLWWSSTQANSSNAYFRGLLSDFHYVKRSSINKAFGCSVRCLRDN